MVVGAKGSPLQLILSAVYQIDNPTGNIPLSEAQRLQKHPLVKYSISLAYGDSYKGYRIVGTEEKYLKHYDASFAEGAVWTSDFDAVIGSTAAQQLKLSMGAHFHGTHGLEQEGQTHEEMEYRVVGILKPTGTVVDKLILTNISSVWHIHGEANPTAEEHAHHDHDTDHQHELEEDTREITALLVKFKSPMGMMQLPRHINTNTTMQAALPAIEVNRLYELLGVGFTTLQIIGGIIMCIAALSVFISLLNSLKNRKYELALMRSLGASPFKLFSMIMLESLLICVTPGKTPRPRSNRWRLTIRIWSKCKSLTPTPKPVATPKTFWAFTHSCCAPARACACLHALLPRFSMSSKAQCTHRSWPAPSPWPKPTPAARPAMKL